MSNVHKCPVCYGVGTVPPGFYDSPGSGTTSNARETCHACNSKGVIIVGDTAPCPSSKLTITVRCKLDHIHDEIEAIQEYLLRVERRKQAEVPIYGIWVESKP